MARQRKATHMISCGSRATRVVRNQLLPGLPVGLPGVLVKWPPFACTCIRPVGCNWVLDFLSFLSLEKKKKELNL